jgi:MFS family permease
MWFVCTLVAISQATWGLVIPILPVYAAQFQASAAQLGVVVGAFSLARVVVDLPAGYLADRMNRRALLLGSSTAVALVQFATAGAPSLSILILTRLLLGAAGGVVVTVGQSILADAHDRAERARGMAILQAMQIAATAAGPAVGGVIAGQFGPRAAYLFAGIVALVVALVSMLRLPRGARPRPHTTGSGIRSLTRNRGFAGVCVAGFAIVFSRLGGQQTLAVLLAYTWLHLSVPQYGLVLSASAVLTIATVAAIAYAIRWSARRTTSASVVATGICFLAMSGAHALPAFLAVVAILAITAEFSGPAAIVYCVETIPSRLRGRGIGLYRTSGDIGGFLGPIVVGEVIDRSSLRVASLCMGVLCLLCGLAFARMTSEPEP